LLAAHLATFSLLRGKFLKNPIIISTFRNAGLDENREDRAGPGPIARRKLDDTIRSSMTISSEEQLYWNRKLASDRWITGVGNVSRVNTGKTCHIGAFARGIFCLASELPPPSRTWGFE
jgi:hypothetical protein